MRFQNGSNKVVIELRIVQFWSEIMLVISNRTRAARTFDFEITRMITDPIALHSVQLPLHIAFRGIILVENARIHKYTKQHAASNISNKLVLFSLLE